MRCRLARSDEAGHPIASLTTCVPENGSCGIEYECRLAAVRPDPRRNVRSPRPVGCRETICSVRVTTGCSDVDRLATEVRVKRGSVRIVARDSWSDGGYADHMRSVAIRFIHVAVLIQILGVISSGNHYKHSLSVGVVEDALDQVD